MLSNQQKVTVVCSGGFDPFHIGHLDHFKAAKALGDKLVVIINRDEFLIRKKGLIFMPLQDRIDIIRALDCVDDVIVAVDEDMSVAETLRIVKPQIFAEGKDRSEGNIPQVEIDICKEINCEIRYGVHGRLRSSSQITQLYPSRTRLPKLDEVIKQFADVWSLWVTGEKVSRGGVLELGVVKKLLLKKPEGDTAATLETTALAQKNGVQVKWYSDSFPFSLNICDPYGDTVLRMEVVLPYLPDILRPTIVVDYRSQPELCRNMIRAYETVWWNSEEPKL